MQAIAAAGRAGDKACQVCRALTPQLWEKMRIRFSCVTLFCNISLCNSSFLIVTFPLCHLHLWHLLLLPGHTAKCSGRHCLLWDQRNRISRGVAIIFAGTQECLSFKIHPLAGRGVGFSFPWKKDASHSLLTISSPVIEIQIDLFIFCVQCHRMKWRLRVLNLKSDLTNHFHGTHYIGSLF